MHAPDETAVNLQPVTGPQTWRGPEFMDREDLWIYELTDHGMAEIDCAIERIILDGVELNMPLEAEDGGPGSFVQRSKTDEQAG
ncbi:hypothetical protein C2W62_31995 [Candidatus Entotheonella serta]|nr:hypothetical protein C2W62_31995 [Candidatus Entotheonella serta]